MDRRGFLTSCLALAAAPAIVRADSLMRVVPRDASIVFDGCASYLDTEAVWLRATMIGDGAGTWVQYFRSLDGENWRPDGISPQEVSAIHPHMLKMPFSGERDIRVLWKPTPPA